MDRFRDFADDVDTVKRFAGDVKYLYKFGKNIYQTLFHPYSTRDKFKAYKNKLVDEYLSKKMDNLFVCYIKVVLTLTLTLALGLGLGLGLG